MTTAKVNLIGLITFSVRISWQGDTPIETSRFLDEVESAIRRFIITKRLYLTDDLALRVSSRPFEGCTALRRIHDVADIYDAFGYVAYEVNMDNISKPIPLCKPSLRKIFGRLPNNIYFDIYKRSAVTSE